MGYHPINIYKARMRTKTGREEPCFVFLLVSRSKHAKYFKFCTAGKWNIQNISKSIFSALKVWEQNFQDGIQKKSTLPFPLLTCIFKVAS